jgi:hypothetical protein
MQRPTVEEINAPVELFHMMHFSTPHENLQWLVLVMTYSQNQRLRETNNGDIFALGG